jgi:hypothetical protein
VTFTGTQQALLERARSEGHPLEPELAGDAATLLRAEVLVAAGASGSEALAQARREHADLCAIEAKKRIVEVEQIASRAWWECPCGREPPASEFSATPVRTEISLTQPECPFCGRKYHEEYRVPPRDAAEPASATRAPRASASAAAPLFEDPA